MAPALAGFHPAVAAWFARRYPAGPTEAQAGGWAAIASGRDTLVAAPTGSGKTLAAFLVAIDRCYRAASSGTAHDGASVVYVSPLRALTVDVSENLRIPLAEIAEVAQELGLDPPKVRVAVRNGDTSPSQRAAMIRDPPEIVVTTPESFYLLLTSAGGRNLLGNVGTVIVDEIHALARDKRGSHLSLSLERLDRLVAAERGERPVRIGLSATQRPIARVARLLVGAGEGRSDAAGAPLCELVDVGHRRPLDVAIELPDDELGSVSTHEQMASALDKLACLIEANRTTLVFVNTRRMAERVAHQLGERLGDAGVSAHHGSLSTARRLGVEARLRAGELRAVVATASLELGIDVGPVELVCQLGSPRSIATFLQRVGRAQHHVGGVPRGRLFPFTRDELVESVALLAATRAGDLDAIEIPVAPLDVLAQQIVAECAASGEDGCSEQELFVLVRHAAPYEHLSRGVFDEVLELVTEGVVTGRGRRGAHLHRDRVNGVLRPRRGARLTALTSGGAIPDVADYKVVLEPEDTLVGTVNEDWAIESMAGDVFLLASATWRIRRIESGTVRVVDAEGAAPTLPFWLGEAPGRTPELSEAVSGLRRLVEAASDGRDPGTSGSSNAAAEIERLAGVSSEVASQVVAYLTAGLVELGHLPTTDRLVLERFFDDTGGMQLVLHSPRGARVNRALGLALRKRFCKRFDFELQAAASDDAVVLSLGPQHSFPLEEVMGYLSPGSVADTLCQAVLPTPMFASRWRWNLGRSLVAPRYRGGRKVPPAIQRMEADDLMAAIFPALAACQENVSGPIEIPDHPIVRQTLDDCSFEAMDLGRLVELLEQVRAGAVTVHCVDTVVPSVLSEEILNGRPYTFLDDAPLEERRTRAVTTRRGLPLESHDLTALDPAVVAQVAAQAMPEPRTADELHDLMCPLVLTPVRPEWTGLFDQLRAARRAMAVSVPGVDTGRWVATESREVAESLVEHGRFEPDFRLDSADGPAEGHPAADDREAGLVAAARGHLEILGPVSAEDLATSIGFVAVPEVRTALACLVAEGSALECRLAGPGTSGPPAAAPDAEPALSAPAGLSRGPALWCSRHLLARIHRTMRDRSRSSFEAVSAQDFMRFLAAWQHVGPGDRLLGADGVLEIVEQLQGFESAVDAWESGILPARVAGYHGALLDEWCARGEIGFGRLSPRDQELGSHSPRRGGATPSPATPVAFFRRDDLDWLLQATRGENLPEPPVVGASAEVLEALEASGALFVTDLCQITRRMPIEIAEALWDGMARGLLTADGFQAVRSLLRRRGLAIQSGPRPIGEPSGTGLSGRSSRPLGSAGIGDPSLSSGRADRSTRPGRPRPRVRPAMAGGRWSQLGAGHGFDPAGPDDPDHLAESVAGQLLERWGVVFWDLWQRESFVTAWRSVLWALRRLEARGVVVGGRFVAGFNGEQFALPEAAAKLRSVARTPLDGRSIRISASDPLNLSGTILPAPRIASSHARSVTLCDGLLVPEDRGATRPASSSGVRRQQAR